MQTKQAEPGRDAGPVALISSRSGRELILIVDHSADPDMLGPAWDRAITQAISLGWDVEPICFADPAFYVGDLDIHRLTR